MSDQPATNPQPNPQKDPDEWVTGDEPMTGPQASYLSTLAQQAGAHVSGDLSNLSNLSNLSKAEASRKIDELQQRTGRGDRSGP